MVADFVEIGGLVGEDVGEEGFYLVGLPPEELKLGDAVYEEDPEAGEVGRDVGLEGGHALDDGELKELGEEYSGRGSDDVVGSMSRHMLL